MVKVMTQTPSPLEPKLISSFNLGNFEESHQEHSAIQLQKKQTHDASVNKNVLFVERDFTLDYLPIYICINLYIIPINIIFLFYLI